MPTPNGVKISIALEELGLPYEAHTVDITKNESWTPEFLSLNPNGKIPALIDPDGPDGKPLGLFESGAILIYLADKTGKLVPADAAGRYETMQWVFFQMASIGPMFGQVGFFHKFAGKEIEDKRPLNRYRDELKRLLGVMETRLAGRQWIMGDLYTIADISMLGWVRNLIGFYGARDLVEFDSFPSCRRVARARTGASGRAARPEYPGAGLALAIALELARALERGHPVLAPRIAFDGVADLAARASAASPFHGIDRISGISLPRRA